MARMLQLTCTLLLATIVGGCATHAAPSAPAAESSVADKQTYLADLRATLSAKWPKNRIVNIVCHGHSVPAGYARTPIVRTFDAYPHLLHERLCTAYPFATTNVIVTAIGGENSEFGAARFDRDVLALHPDVVTIDYGLNDRGIGLDRARRAWVSMIEKSQAAHVKIILLTPTADVNAKLDVPADPLNAHARQIRELAGQYHVGLVDSLESFKAHVRAGGKIDDLLVQSNHPNRRGHELVATALAEWFIPPPHYPAHWFTPVSKEGAPSWEVLPQEAAAGEVILSKRNELGILSNFAPTPFTFRGQRYASLEGFWQMMKYPQEPADPRATFASIEWKYTRDQVAQMSSFEAKHAGDLGEVNMKKMGITWVSFEGKLFDYRAKDPGEHYRLIVAAMREKLNQNPEVKRVLLSTGDLILRPDHHQEPDAPPEWRYYEIWMQIRSELQNGK